MATIQENGVDKAELAKTIYEMWRHENDIANQKIAIYFTALAILIVALPNAPLVTPIVGLSLSLFWLVSIGRTVAFRIFWKAKVDELKGPSDSLPSEYILLPTPEDEKNMPWYGRVPSKIVLMGTPSIGILFWLILLLISLR